MLCLYDPAPSHPCLYVLVSALQSAAKAYLSPLCPTSPPSLQSAAKAGFDVAVLAEWSDSLLPPIAAVAVNVKVQQVWIGAVAVSLSYYVRKAYLAACFL